MTKIYVIRHCEAEGNQKRIFQGRVDLDISELGKVQLDFLQKRFEGVKLDAVYSSPLIRAKKTAAAVADGRNLEIKIKDGLRELDGGVVEGKPFAEALSNTPLGEVWNNHPQDFAPEGGEKMRDAYERIWNAVLEVAKENKDKTVAVASHGGSIRCLTCRLVFGTIEKLKDMRWSENTSVALLEFDDDFNCTLKYFNDTSHVPEEYLPKRNRLADMAGGKK